MARGRDTHQARKGAVASLGKELSRRARSKCELCEDNFDMAVVEVAPVPEEPDTEAALLACGRCRALVEGGRWDDAADLRFLESVVWAELAPVQITAVRLLRRLAAAEVPWAVEADDGLWLDEGIEARVQAG